MSSIFPSFNICERDKRLWRNEIVFFVLVYNPVRCIWVYRFFFLFFFLLIAKIVLLLPQISFIWLLRL